MRHIHIKSRKLAALILVALASVVLAACGSSSNSSSTSTNTSANTSASSTTPTTSTGAPSASAPRTGRFSAVRECLKKEGITLPKRKARLGGPGEPQLPSGVSRAKLEAALKKCGGSPHGTFPGAGRRFFNSPAVTKAYAKFAACMRAQGVKLPAPNTSGKGPIFNTKGIDTTSPTFRSADAKCRPDLLGAFRPRPGVGGPGAGGAPGSPPSAG